MDSSLAVSCVLISVRVRVNSGRRRGGIELNSSTRLAQNAAAASE